MASEHTVTAVSFADGPEVTAIARERASLEFRGALLEMMLSEVRHQLAELGDDG